MNIIFIYGAEFNYLLATLVFGERIEEKEHYEGPEEEEKKPLDNDSR